MGIHVVGLDRAQRETRSQHKVVTSADRKGVSYAFESIPGRGLEIERILRFAKKTMNEEFGFFPSQGILRTSHKIVQGELGTVLAAGVCEQV